MAISQAKNTHSLVPNDLIKQSELLSRHSYIKIGGVADFFAIPGNLEELLSAINHCSENKIPYVIIGKGSNILFDDKGFRGCVISLLNLQNQEIEKISSTTVKVSAGMRNFQFVNYCQKLGLSGMEFLSYIPGTIGGSIVMNAGCLDYKINEYAEVSDFLVSVTILKKNRPVIKKSSELKFAYRYSSLKGEIVLAAEFQLNDHPIENLKEDLSFHFKQRAKKMPMYCPSLGSMFKNPLDFDRSAGWLIENAGLKGYRIGDIRISPLHANIFENMGKGRSDEVLKLIDHIQEEVFKKFKVRLELEIEYITETQK